MITLEAPYPGIATTTFLPNPTFGDSDGLAVSVDVSYAMTGKRRTYITSSSDHKLNYTFQLTRMKGLELRAFILKYSTTTIRLTNWKNEVWIVKMLTSPAGFDALGRTDPGRESTGITLQFQGTKQ